MNDLKWTPSYPHSGEEHRNTFQQLKKLGSQALVSLKFSPKHWEFSSHDSIPRPRSNNQPQETSLITFPLLLSSPCSLATPSSNSASSPHSFLSTHGVLSDRHLSLPKSFPPHTILRASYRESREEWKVILSSENILPFTMWLMDTFAPFGCICAPSFSGY